MKNIRSVFMRMNYVLLALLACCFLIAPAQAAIPAYINVQGVLLKDGAPVAAAAYALRVTIYTTETGGAPIWTCPKAFVTVDDKGFFSKRVGGNNLNAPNQPLSQLNFDTQYWVEISILNATYTQTIVTLPRQPLSSAPYAISASKLFADAEVFTLDDGGADHWSTYIAEVTSTKGKLAGLIVNKNVIAGGANAVVTKVNNSNVKENSIVLITDQPPSNYTQSYTHLKEVGNGYFIIDKVYKNARVGYLIVNNEIEEALPAYNPKPDIYDVYLDIELDTLTANQDYTVNLSAQDAQHGTNLKYMFPDGTQFYADQESNSTITGNVYKLRIEPQYVSYLKSSGGNTWTDSYVAKDNVDADLSSIGHVYIDIHPKSQLPPMGGIGDKEYYEIPWPPNPSPPVDEYVNWQQKVVSPVIEALKNPSTLATDPLLSGINNAFASKTTLTQYALKTEVAGLALADGSVTSNKLFDGAVISNKLALNSVTSDKIVDGAISNADIATNAGIADNKIAGISAGKISGQLIDGQIANLSASKISGQFGDSQLSGISAGKISGQLADTQLAGISATKVLGQLADSQIAGVSSAKVSGLKALAFQDKVAGANAFNTVTSFAALPASTGSGALAFVNAGNLGESGMYMDMMGGSWHKISSFRAPLADMTGSLAVSQVSGLGTLATRNSVTDADISGTLSAAKIPALDASKITSGTLPLATIPVLDAARIPAIDASKITTGTISLSKVTFSNSTENLSNWMEYKAATTLYFRGIPFNIPAQLKFKQGSSFNGNVYPEVNSTDDATGYYLGSSGLRWRRVYATTFYGGSTTIVAADLNEKHNVSGNAEDGDVMMISGNDVLAVCNVAGSTKVAGIYRGTEGGLTMNEELKDGKPIVYTGRYEVKVDASAGAIEPGDLLVSSSNAGYAMKAPANPQAGTIIGKALKGMAAGQKGKLLVLVTLQ